MHQSSSIDAQAMVLFEYLPASVIVVDREWRISALNRQAASLVQQTREAVPGKLLWETLPEALGIACKPRYQQALDAQVAVRFDVWYSPLQRPLQVTASPTREGLLLFFQEM